LIDRLPFLTPFAADPAASALLDAATPRDITYDTLATTIAALQPALTAPQKSLVFCFIESTMSSTIAYLAAAQSGHAVALLDPTLPQREALIESYQPLFIIAATAPTGYQKLDWPLENITLWQRIHDAACIIHPDLFLLLLTSGSTGGEKFVRLSYENITSNIKNIITSLDLSCNERAFLHLPLSYSFGLSVLHTQLSIGGSVVLTAQGMMERGFWDLARETEATLFAGVPYHYTMLARLGLTRLNLPHVKTFLQAGGHLDADLARQLCTDITARQGRFFMMYGQTEAAPRISCLAAHEQPEKIGTVGKILPHGQVTIQNEEIIYQGTNVMLGYCTQQSDLALGDTQGGILATGDLGRLDESGFLTITGRKQRFAKLYGVRIALDELEQKAGTIAPIAIIEHIERLIIATTDPTAPEAIKAALLTNTKLQAGWFSIQVIEAFPYRSNGKLDYTKLAELLP